MKLLPRHYTSVGHWFSYNWGWLLGGILLIAFLIFASRPGGEPEPDYILSWVGTTMLSEREAAAVIEAASRAGTDQNGDGQVVVSVQQFPIDFHMTSSDIRYADNYSQMLKMFAQLQTRECYLYLLEDPEQFQSATGVLQYLDGSYASEDDHYESAQWEQMCVPWDIAELEHTAYLARRTLFGEEDPNVRFPGGDALFAALSGS